MPHNLMQRRALRVGLVAVGSRIYAHLAGGGVKRPSAIKRLVDHNLHPHPDARIPQRAHASDAAFDLFLPDAVLIHPGRQLIPLGFAIQLPAGYCAEIQPRSSVALHGITGANGSANDSDILYGLIDQGYTGEIHIVVNHHGSHPYLVAPHTRIAQLIIRHTASVRFVSVTALSATDRADRAIGSSGI